jgi:hypothetical protein
LRWRVEIFSRARSIVRLRSADSLRPQLQLLALARALALSRAAPTLKL